ncbi:hypothetical protein M9Y10_025199 [Tritrichomonas musculus]|uniref:Uncharacterized protein n=1 Tax=Tritrichomonas musculus TaxID=1915356 RepID=A0ABR2HAU4_9EUKA
MYGLMLLRWIGVKPNKKEAAKYLKYASDKGDIRSMVLYGIMLNSGDGIELDLKEAARYFKMAADKGGADTKFADTKLDLKCIKFANNDQFRRC